MVCSLFLSQYASPVLLHAVTVVQRSCFKREGKAIVVFCETGFEVEIMQKLHYCHPENETLSNAVTTVSLWQLIFIH